jgi:hydroxymethylpyrimidine/phosphomethylpyrimidine kinase
MVSPVLAGPAVRVLAIGGLDPSGGAGLTRDFVTAQARGAEVVLLGTAWTDQSRQGVRGCEPRAPERLAAAVRVAARTVQAVKIGMVATPELAKAIAGALDEFGGPVVLDPVLWASSGGALFAGAPEDLFPLVARASLTTPNLAEAAALAGGVVETPDQAAWAARQLLARGAAAVLVKGGHLSGPATDVLVTAEGEELFTADRVPGVSPRGTGCALATALAVELARGASMAEAVASAKSWLRERIAGARMVGGEWRL